MSIHYAALTSFEIETALRKNVNTRRIFRGVYPADCIPQKLRLPAGIVVNTDPKDKQGQHWIAIYMDKNKKTTFFDSYGEPPRVKYHKQFLELKGQNVQHNTKRLQDSSTSVCGHYCCEFLLSCAKGKSLKFFTKPFKRCNTASNDARVILCFHKHFGETQGGMGGSARGHAQLNNNQCACSQRRCVGSYVDVS